MGKEDKKEIKLNKLITSQVNAFLDNRISNGGKVDWLAFAQFNESDYHEIMNKVESGELEEEQKKMFRIEKVLLERELTDVSNATQLKVIQDRLLVLEKELGSKKDLIVFEYGKITGIQKKIEERRKQIESDLKENK